MLRPTKSQEPSKGCTLVNQVYFVKYSLNPAINFKPEVVRSFLVQIFTVSFWHELALHAPDV